MSRSNSWVTHWKQHFKNSRGVARRQMRRSRRCLLERLESREVLAASPIGPEFLVNTAFALNQINPVMAMDADGDFVVVWQSNGQDGSGYGIYAQRYNAAGATQGAEIPVNSFTLGSQTNPSVAMDADGDFEITWQSDHQVAAANDIYVRRYNAVGEDQGIEFRVNSFTAGEQSFPSVSKDVDGDFVVAWQSNGQDGSIQGVYAQRFNSAGEAQGVEFQVNTFTAANQSSPTVAMDADGDFVVAWHSSFQDVSGYGIYAQRYNAMGEAQGSEFMVNTSSVGSQMLPSVAMDADGDFVVTWESNDGYGYGIYAQRYNPAGVTQGGEFRVNSITASNQRSSAVSMDVDGDFVVTWQSSDASGYGIYARGFSAAGVAPGIESRVNTFTTGSQIQPAMSMDADGDFVVAWQSDLQDGSNHGVYAQRFNESTTTAGPMVTDVRDMDDPITQGELLASSLDTLTVVFSEDLNVVGGSSGTNSVRNPANWQLTQNGTNVSNLISSITFGMNIGTGKFEADLTLANMLAAGTYRLTALDTIRGVTGNPLDGDFNGTPGGSYEHMFVIASVQAAGDEFRVNTYTTSAQEHPSMAMDADGDFVVVWESVNQDGSLAGVYAQRYDAAGVVQGVEFRVNTTTIGFQQNPSVAMDADGDFVITWLNYALDGSGGDIYARLFSAAGLPLGSEFRVNTFTSTDQVSSSVAMDADGDFVVTWEGFSSVSSDDIFARRYNAAGVAQGGEFRVNTFTMWGQKLPTVALDADGDFIVTWESSDQDGNLWGIYAQRYNATGEAQGTEFRVNTTTTNSQREAVVAMDSDGDFVVAWHSLGQDGSNLGVYAQRFNATGMVQGGEFRVNTFTLGIQSAPSVAIDSDGDFVVMWESENQDSSQFGIYAQRYNAAGMTQGSEFLVNTYTTNDQYAPSVAMDADGDFVVAWQSSIQDGSQRGIYAQRYDESTTTAGPIVTEVRDGDRQITPGGRLSTTLDTLTVVFSQDMNVAGGSSGASSVLNPANWQLTQDGVDVSNLITGITFALNVNTGKFEAELTLAAPLSAATYRLTVRDSIRGLTGDLLDGDFSGTPGGNYQHSFAIANMQSAGPEFRVNSITANSQSAPSVAMDADGDYVVAWQSNLQDGSSYGIYAQRYNALGSALGSPFRVNTYTTGAQAWPSVAMDADGDFIVTWTSSLQDGSGNGIYAQRYSASGSTLGGEFLVNTFTANSQSFSSVAMDSDGDFVVTWTSNLQDGSGNGVYARRFNASGTALGNEFRVNTFTTGNQLAPTIAMDADGDFIVAWQTNGQDGSSYAIYAQRYDSAGVAQGGEFRVNTFTTGNQSNAAVAMDADGDFVVSWTSFDQDGSGIGVYAQRYNSAGVAQGIEFPVNTYTTNSQSGTSVAMDADGDFVVTWNSINQDSSNSGVYGRRYNAGGIAQGTEFLVNTYTTNSQTVPAVAQDADGDFVVAWSSQGQDGSSYGIYAQRYQSDAPVQLTSSGLTLTGSVLDDVMSVERIAPAGSPVYLNAVRNGISYSIDATKVTNVVMNGSNGQDRLSIDAALTTPSTLNGNDGNDTLVGGGGNDIMNGGPGNDFFVFDTDTALGSDIVSDTSDIDTLDFSATETLAVTISLTDASNQVVNANLTLSILSANTFDNIIGGALGDTLIGNAQANRITGGGGDDTLTGGAGNDTYMFDADLVLGADTINESGGGIDTLDFSATTSRNLAIDLSNSAVQTVAAGFLTLNLSAGNTIENVVGGSLKDTITGNGLDNLLNGGPGDDTYLFDSDLVLGSDTIQDSSGSDSLNFGSTTTQSVSVNLSSTVAQVVTASNLTLTLTSDQMIENVVGGSMGDTLIGNALANVLTGRGGADTLNGGDGNDIYAFDTDIALNSDTIVDPSGIDTLDFSATTTRAITINLSNAASQVVNTGLHLTLSSATSIENVIGGSLGDTIIGNTLDNQLTGGPGDDTLTGDAGNDTYFFAANVALGVDTINESGLGGGADTLNFSLTTTQAVAVNLSATTSQVVNPNLSLILSAVNSIENVIGGSLGDTLTGNTLNNRLTGGGGNDVLTGGAGDDSYLFDTDFNLGLDTINESGGGIDTLNFSQTTSRAVAVNLANAGIQTVNAGLRLNLSSGTTIENVIGGALGDTLTGNTLNNTFVGGGGNDTLTGGAGNDTYVFDTDLALGSDTIVDSGDLDTIDFSSTTTRRVFLDLSNPASQVVNTGLTLTLSSNNTIENVIGGALGDILVGNTLTNTLTGNGGDDVLTGRAGNDVLNGGSGKNILIGGDGLDQLTGGTSEDLMLGARYDHDNNFTALDSLLSEWTSLSSFSDRVGHLLGTLPGGLNGGNTLSPITVHEDNAADALVGGSGRDWYLRNSLGATVALRDAVTDADVDSVFTEIDTWL